MIHSIARSVAGVLVLGLGGCVTGLIYSDVTMPLDENMNNTRMGAVTSDLDMKEVREPIFTSVRVQWDGNAYGDIMKRAGIGRAQFADVKTFSLVFGIWSQVHVTVNGDPVKDVMRDSEARKKADGTTEKNPVQ